MEVSFLSLLGAMDHRWFQVLHIILYFVNQIDLCISQKMVVHSARPLAFWCLL